MALSATHRLFRLAVLVLLGLLGPSGVLCMTSAQARRDGDTEAACVLTEQSNQHLYRVTRQVGSFGLQLPSAEASAQSFAGPDLATKWRLPSAEASAQSFAGPDLATNWRLPSAEASAQSFAGPDLATNWRLPSAEASAQSFGGVAAAEARATVNVQTATRSGSESVSSQPPDGAPSPGSPNAAAAVAGSYHVSVGTGAGLTESQPFGKEADGLASQLQASQTTAAPGSHQVDSDNSGAVAAQASSGVGTVASSIPNSGATFGASSTSSADAAAQAFASHWPTLHGAGQLGATSLAQAFSEPGADLSTANAGSQALSGSGLVLATANAGSQVFSGTRPVLAEANVGSQSSVVGYTPVGPRPLANRPVVYRPVPYQPVAYRPSFFKPTTLTAGSVAAAQSFANNWPSLQGGPRPFPAVASSATVTNVEGSGLPAVGGSPTSAAIQSTQSAQAGAIATASVQFAGPGVIPAFGPTMASTSAQPAQPLGSMGLAFGSGGPGAAAFTQSIAEPPGPGIEQAEAWASNADSTQSGLGFVQGLSGSSGALSSAQAGDVIVFPHSLSRDAADVTLEELVPPLVDSPPAQHR